MAAALMLAGVAHPLFGESPLPSDVAGRRLQSAMIWSPTVPAGTQAYVAFRKTFELPDPAAPPVLHMFADSRYMLWVNGAYVLRGPCRFNPKRPEYDSVDLRPFLKQGGNTLVVLVHHYAGAINGRIMRHAPGLTANTIETVSDDAYGSDARERNEWLQDPAMPNFITTRVALAGPESKGKPVYSDPRLLKNLLRHAALAQLPDGRILATFPTDRGPEDCHYVIEDYACQWVEALRVYFEATGDKPFVREIWPTLTRQMQWFLDRRTPRGLLLAREYASFDNPLAYITCEGATINAYLYQALLDSDCLGRALGQNPQAAAYAQAAKELGVAYNRQFWNEAEGAYNSAILGEKTLGPTAHAQLLALDRGLVPEKRVAAARKWLLANYKNPGGFHCGNNPDFERMVAQKAGINMPVVYYWMFQELYRMNTAAMDQEVISEMRRRWGPMVEHRQDAGTLAESFVDSNGGGGNESCHNYGAVPAYFLSSYVLGVRLDGPVRDKRLLIEPHLGDLTNAEGVVVTEFGPVSVSWKRADNQLLFRLKTPPGVTTSLRLPDGNAATLMLDGKRAVAEVRGRCAVASIGGGKHEGRVGLLPGLQQETDKQTKKESNP